MTQTTFYMRGLGTLFLYKAFGCNKYDESITNNVESSKKINEKAQTANFSVLARGRRPRKTLCEVL